MAKKPSCNGNIGKPYCCVIDSKSLLYTVYTPVLPLHLFIEHKEKVLFLMDFGSKLKNDRDLVDF